MNYWFKLKENVLVAKGDFRIISASVYVDTNQPLYIVYRGLSATLWFLQR